MGAGRANLRWDPDTSATLAGYRAYRATSTAGPFVLGQDAPLATLDPAAPTITLTDFYTDGVWYFQVTAYLTTGVEGFAAGPISKTIVRPAVRIAETMKG